MYAKGGIGRGNRAGHRKGRQVGSEEWEEAFQWKGAMPRWAEDRRRCDRAGFAVMSGDGCWVERVAAKRRRLSEGGVGAGKRVTGTAGRVTKFFGKQHNIE